MSPKFIPENQSNVDQLSHRLSQTPFRDVETFVSMYNSGLINQRNRDVSEIAEEIITSFKGIEKRNQSLYFLSSGEIAIDELSEYVNAYSCIIPMQRAVKDASLDRSAQLRVVGGKIAAFDTVEENGEIIEKERVISDKLVKSTTPTESIERIFGLQLEEGSQFTVEDVLRIDDSKVFNALEQFSI